MPPTNSSATAPSTRMTASEWLVVRSATVDLRAIAREHIPQRAELVDGLTGGVAGLRVAHEVVERMTVVRHLGAAIAALGRAEQRSLDVRPSRRRPRDRQRRPETRACPVAGARHRLVGHEVVQRATVAVDEDVAELRGR